MNTIYSWFETFQQSLRDLGISADGAAVHWPSFIAAGITLVVCVAAAIAIIDAGRRTAELPAWSRMRSEISFLTSECEGTRRLIAGLNLDRDALVEEQQALRSEKVLLDGVLARREAEERTLTDIANRVASFSEDRLRIDAIRNEMQRLLDEELVLKQANARLKEEQTERQISIDRLRTRHEALEEQFTQVRASRDQVGAEVAQRKAELDAVQRQTAAATASLRAVEDEIAGARSALGDVGRGHEKLERETAAMTLQLAQLRELRQDIENKIAAAHAGRLKVSEENGRLETSRSSLWMEFVSLQEKRNVAVAELNASEATLRDMRHQRDVLHGEIEMLRRVMIHLPGLPQPVAA